MKHETTRHDLGREPPTPDAERQPYVRPVIETLGGTLADIGQPILALLVMGALLFGATLLLFQRKGLAQR